MKHFSLKESAPDALINWLCHSMLSFAKFFNYVNGKKCSSVRDISLMRRFNGYETQYLDNLKNKIRFRYISSAYKYSCTIIILTASGIIYVYISKSMNEND